MSNKFGLSHRQVVRDVNEGSVVPATSKAVTSKMGVSAQADDRVTRLDDGKQRLAEALISAAGAVGKKVGAEMDRKAAIEGYNMAGTEEGRKAADVLSQALSTKIFGPSPKLRAAQERIVKDQTDALATKLFLDNEDFGHKMTPEEWEEHTNSTLESSLNKFEDEAIKDQITMRYGQNMTAVQREWVKKNHVFLQNEERETVMDSMSKSAEMAQLDMESGDPQRVSDAQQRLDEALVKPEGMTDEAYQGALRSVVMNELSNGRGAMYEMVEQRGLLSELPFEEREELETQKMLFDAQNDENFIIGMRQLEYLATSTGDVEQVTAMAKQLQAANPELFANGIAPVVEAAFDRQMQLQEEAAARRTRQHMAATGDPALARESGAEQQVAMEDHLNTLAEAEVRKELAAKYQREGKTMPDDVEITQMATNRWLLENPGKWAREWATNNVPTDRVKRMGSMVVNNIGRLDMTEEGAQQLANDLDSLMVLRGEDPVLFSKHFDPTDAAKLVAYHEAISMDAQNPFEVVQRLRDRAAKEEKGTWREPQNAERTAEKVDRVIDAFVAEKGDKYLGFWDREPDNLQELKLKAEELYTEALGFTDSSNEAVNYALQKLNQGSTVIGNKFIQGGAKLDKNSYGNNFDRYLEGLNDSDEARMQLIQEYGLAEDFDLRSDTNRYVVNPDGSGATVWITAPGPYGPVEKPVVLQVPRRPEHILPTNGEQRIESIRKNLLESRSGGSFGAQFEEIKERN